MGDSDSGSAASSDSGMMMMLGDEAATQRRERSLSFDDLYALAPAQDGLSANSKFSFIPLEGHPGGASGLRKVPSLDDLQSMQQEREEEYYASSYDASSQGDDASIMSVPAAAAATPKAYSRRHRSASVDDAPLVQEGPRQRSSRRRPEERARARGGRDDSDDSEDGYDGEEEGGVVYDDDAPPSERLFGKKRARQLRHRIARSRGVSSKSAQEALDAASAAISANGGTETIEFITWFSVWCLLIFYLLFYSSYGPMLWRFLYGPMGVLLALPFGFAVLFWLISFVFTEED